MVWLLIPPLIKENNLEDNNEQEVLYTNSQYRVEIIVLENVPKYGIYNNDSGVLEADTLIYPQALNSADELEAAVNSFFESKEVVDTPVIATA